MMNEQNDAQLDALEMIAAAQRANRFWLEEARLRLIAERRENAERDAEIRSNVLKMREAAGYASDAFHWACDAALALLDKKGVA